MPLNSPRLWIVATPLGNPGDCSPRAREVLAQATAVLAEDTRRAGLLFARLGVKAQRFISYHDHNESARLPQVMDMLRQGQSLALVSDAGMPLVADPGYRLVRACREEGINVSVVPGPCAAVTALAGSGIAPQPFAFIGFLPRKKSEQASVFRTFAPTGCTLIFYERKNRLAESLETAHAVLGDRPCCVARELTKPFEEYILFSLGKRPPLDELLGEITVIIGPSSCTATTTEMDEADYRELVKSLAHELTAEHPGIKPKELARLVHERAPAMPVKDIYRTLAEE